MSNDGAADRNDSDKLRGVLRFIWASSAKFTRTQLLFAIILIMVASVLGALAPVVLKLIVDHLTTSAGIQSVIPLVLIGLYVGGQWLARITTELGKFVYARAERQVLRSISLQAVAHVIRLPLAFHVKKSTGAVTQVLQDGMQGTQMILQSMLFSLLPVLLEVAMAIVIFSHLKQHFFLMLLAIAFFTYVGVFAYSAWKVAGAAKVASAAQVGATSAITDVLVSYETVKLFSIESVVQAKIGKRLGDVESAWIRFARSIALNGLAVAVVFAVFLGLTVFFAVRDVQASRMTVGTFVLVITYMLQIVRPVEILGFAVQGFSQGLVYLQRLRELMAVPREDVRDAATMTGVVGRLEVRGVSFAYEPERPVLDKVSFTVESGATIAIVGGSGSGKSSIVRLLTRLVEPDSGQILMDGVPLSELPIQMVRRAVAVVPQDAVLFDESIAYNIAFGREDVSQRDIEEAARVAHLHAFISGLPEKYDTKIGERGVRLSGGERQRLSIARAALRRPLVYVFDEATSSLDSATEQQILDNVREISLKSTTVVIAHRLSTIVHADQILVLENGQVCEIGSHRSLLARGGRYASLWAAQERGYAVA